MRRATTGGVAAVILGAACLAAFADPAELMPKPLEGWTVSSPTYGESVIAREGTGDVPPKRIEVSRDYRSGGSSGLRIALNTHDRRGVKIIEFVNTASKRNPEAASSLAAKGIVPFSFGSRQGVTMRVQEDGQVTGAALQLGTHGTLTLEGIHDGEPGTVALDQVKAYLKRTDLDRMDKFVRQSNAIQKKSKAAE